MKAKLLHGALAAAFVAAAGAAAAAEITIYKQPGFSGEAITLRDSKTTLTPFGFSDQASSVVVKSGRWELCSQPNFQGDCVTVGPGQYASLDPRVYHRMESAREVGNIAANTKEERYAQNRPWDRRWREDRYGGTPSIELYGGRDFRGPAMSLNSDAESLGDRGISSIAINEGTWQICTRPGFEGRCRTLNPGEYRDLGRFDNMVGSVKRIG